MENLPHCEQDFIVSELISELKTENTRKSAQLKRLQTLLLVTALAAIIGIFATAGMFVYYLNQYDFTSTTEYITEQTAEGVYAIIDSEGNVVGHDLTLAQLTQLVDSIAYGESNSNESNSGN